MANFIVTYDLNGPHPTHAEMDQHLALLGLASVRGRLLETVWFVSAPMTCREMRDYAAQILGPEDLLLVAKTDRVAWTKLLVDSKAFKLAFEA